MFIHYVKYSSNCSTQGNLNSAWFNDFHEYPIASKCLIAHSSLYLCYPSVDLFSMISFSHFLPVDRHVLGYSKKHQCLHSYFSHYLFNNHLLNAYYRLFNAFFITCLKIKLLFLKKNYLFLAVLGLCCCTWPFSSCSERGLLFVVVRGLLVVARGL